MSRLPILVLLLAIAATCWGEVALAQGARRLRVVGIAASDVLNVREAPGASARIVGMIPPGGRGLVATGPARGGWVAIRWGDVEGWVQASYLAEDVPIGRPGARRATMSGWWVLLGSFSDPAGTESSVAKTSDLARQCGLRAFAAPSGSFGSLARGFTVVVVGPFRTRQEGEGARAQAAPCLPQAYIRQSTFAE